jgi:hypothetical protein
VSQDSSKLYPWPLLLRIIAHSPWSLPFSNNSTTSGPRRLEVQYSNATCAVNFGVNGFDRIASGDHDAFAFVITLYNDGDVCVYDQQGHWYGMESKRVSLKPTRLWKIWKRSGEMSIARRRYRVSSTSRIRCSSRYMLVMMMSRFEKRSK